MFLDIILTVRYLCSQSHAFLPKNIPIYLARLKYRDDIACAISNEFRYLAKVRSPQATSHFHRLLVLFCEQCQRPPRIMNLEQQNTLEKEE